MSTTIQNNQPTLFVGSTRDLLPTEKSTLDALPSEWKATESVGAKNNNRLAMQTLQSTTTPTTLTMARVSAEIDKGPTDSLPPEIPKMLNEQNAGPAQTFITENSGFLTVGTTVDSDGSGNPNIGLVSTYDPTGKLLRSVSGRDENEDGKIDSLETFDYRDGKLASYSLLQVSDNDGRIESAMYIADSDNNGKFDTKISGDRSERGGWLNKTTSHDINEDGILDIAIHETFDEAGNRLTHSAEIFDEGMFGANATTDVEAVLNEDALLQVPKSPSESYSFAEDEPSYINMIGTNENPIEHKLINKGGELEVQVNIDFDGDRRYDAHQNSKFDKNGSLKADAYTLDSTGDGQRDIAEDKTYDDNGNITQHSIRHDADGNNVFERKVRREDTNGDGILNQESIRNYNNDRRRLESASVARDVDGDGVMDIALEKTFDKDGNETSFKTTYAKDGLYGGSYEQPSWEDLFGKADFEATSKSDDLKYNAFELTNGLSPIGLPVNQGTNANNPTAAAQFISENAGYSNTLFTYDVDDQGNVSNIRQIMGNSNQAAAGEALGDVALFNGQPNLLLLPNGASLVDANSELTIVDGKLQINGTAHKGDAYFSHSQALSTDGQQHFQITTDAYGNASVKIEDLRNLGDQDFNDLEIKILNGKEPPAIAGLKPNPHSAINYRIPDLLL